MGMQTNLTLPTLNLTPGAKYYSTVYAFNTLGMASYDTSNGFVVDINAPSSGTVYTASHYQDHSHKGQYIEASWIGFVDDESFISDYFYAIEKLGQAPKFESSDFATSVKRDILFFEHGQEYVVHVKAIDAAGHESEIVTSSPFRVDLTPPQVIACSAFDTVFSERLHCICKGIVEDGDRQICRCVPLGTFLSQVGEWYQVSVISDTDSKDDTRLYLGEHADWVIFNRINYTTYLFSSYFKAKDETILPIVVTQDATLNFALVISKCMVDQSSPNSKPLVFNQLGQHYVQVIHLCDDDESDVKQIELGIGTTTTGFQLFPLALVASESPSSFRLPLQHGLSVYATAICTNNAGHRTVIKSQPLVIDQTAPVIENIVVSVTAAGGDNTLFKVRANWHVVDKESNVSDCLWKIGECIGI